MHLNYIVRCWLIVNANARLPLTSIHPNKDTHTQLHAGTDLKGSGSEGVCRGETKEQTTESLCVLQ